MRVAKVLATATATMKHASLQGYRLLLVQPYGPDGTTPDGEPVLAVDTLGGGRDAEVVITSDGRHGRELLRSDTTPVRWTVIGIKDA